MELPRAGRSSWNWNPAAVAAETNACFAFPAALRGTATQLMCAWLPPCSCRGGAVVRERQHRHGAVSRPAQTATHGEARREKKTRKSLLLRCRSMHTDKQDRKRTHELKLSGNTNVIAV